MWGLFSPELRWVPYLSGGAVVYAYTLTGLPLWVVPVFLVASLAMVLGRAFS